MPLNGYPVTGEGETCSMEMAAQEAGTPLPLRPARAKANDAAAWHAPGKVVADNADAGASWQAMVGKAPRGPIEGKATGQGWGDGGDD